VGAGGFSSSSALIKGALLLPPRVAAHPPPPPPPPPPAPSSHEKIHITNTPKKQITVVIADDKVMVLHSRAGIIMDIVFSASGSSPSDVWEVLRKVLGARNKRQAANAAAESVAASLCFRACARVRPTLMAELAGNKMAITDIKRAARASIGFRLSTAGRQLPPAEQRIFIKPGTCFIAVVDQVRFFFFRGVGAGDVEEGARASGRESARADRAPRYARCSPRVCTRKPKRTQTRARA
jgi:hypothetical protein